MLFAGEIRCPGRDSEWGCVKGVRGRMGHRKKFLLRPLTAWFDFFNNIEQMKDRAFLGEMEMMVLLALIRLGDEAYGVPVARELRAIRGRDVALGSIYAALERLEAKGLVTSSLGEPTPERGGRARRFFQVTKEGMRQVQATRRALTTLWRSLPEHEGGKA